MTKPKTLDQLRAEKERAETQLAQETAQAGASGEQKEVSGERRTARSAPTAFAIWAARLRALPRRSKISHAPK